VGGHNDLRPFESIEGTLEFMKLLDDAILESSCELRHRLAATSLYRSRTGLLLAIYKLDQLSDCVRQSKRILNDLSLIRSALMGQSVDTHREASQEASVCR
jgi:hypothetical protein